MYGVRLCALLVVLSGMCLGAECQGGGGPSPFALPQWTLRVSTQGQGLVERTSDADCQEISEDAIDAGTEVRLIATPARGWVFDHWEGDATGDTPEITVAMDADKSLTAVFVPAFNLTVVLDGDGQVLLAEAGDDVPYADAAFPQGASITLVAIPAEGWLFAGWRGDAVGADDTISIVMNADHRLTAVFVPVAGRRIVTINGIMGRMTIAMSGSTIKGVWRDGRLGSDLDGAIADRFISIICSTPGFNDAVIGVTAHPDGTWSGTINGSGYVDTPLIAESVGFTGFADPAAGVRTTTVTGINGYLAVAIEGETLRGTWRAWGDFGADVDGTIRGNQILFTATSPGYQDMHVTATINADGSWTGTLNGSGFHNEPFTAATKVFP